MILRNKTRIGHEDWELTLTFLPGEECGDHSLTLPSSIAISGSFTEGPLAKLQRLLNK
jgi:hypothetical protein